MAVRHLDLSAGGGRRLTRVGMSGVSPDVGLLQGDLGELTRPPFLSLAVLTSFPFWGLWS